MSMRRRTRPVAPDQTALAVGLSGLALTVTSALVRAVVTGGATRLALAAAVFALGSLGGLGLGVLGVWSAAKAWLRDEPSASPPTGGPA